MLQGTLKTTCQPRPSCGPHGFTIARFIAPTAPRTGVAFRDVRSLSAGANTITHGLNLAAPFAVIVQAKNDTTGEDIGVRTTAESANSVVISVTNSVTNIRITIIG